MSILQFAFGILAMASFLNRGKPLNNSGNELPQNISHLLGEYNVSSPTEPVKNRWLMNRQKVKTGGYSS